MSFKSITAAACLSLLAATSATAATFSFTNDGPDQATVDFGDFTVTSGSTNFLFGPEPSVVNQTSSGLGVAALVDSQPDQVDGNFGGTETLTFVFDKAVGLTGISFGSFDPVGGGFFNPPDFYGLSLDGAAPIALSDNPWVGYELVSIFSLTATSGSDWRVTSISYDLAPVPLPAGAVLLVTGLGAFGAISRRRKRVSA